MIIFIGYIFAFLAVWLLNNKGSYTANTQSKFASIACHLIAVIAFINVYGAARGIFIYLAVVALVGIIITAITSTITRTITRRNAN